MFDCCRVPGEGLDWAVSHAKEGDDGRSGHVVVLHRGRVWKLEPWQGGKLLSLDELQRYATSCASLYLRTQLDRPDKYTTFTTTRQKSTPV